MQVRIIERGYNAFLAIKTLCADKIWEPFKSFCPEREKRQIHSYKTVNHKQVEKYNLQFMWQ